MIKAKIDDKNCKILLKGIESFLSAHKEPL